MKQEMHEEDVAGKLRNILAMDLKKDKNRKLDEAEMDDVIANSAAIQEYKSIPKQFRARLTKK